MPDGAGQLSPQQLDQIEKQWCTQGLKAHRQALQALDRAFPLHAGAGKFGRAVAEARADAAIKELGTRALLLVEDRLKRRWIEQLRQRGDMRSLAAADYLLSTLGRGDAAQASALLHLLSLAQSSRDPLVFMIWRLANPYCGSQPHCSALPMSDWRSLDSLNLLAWLPTRTNGQSADELNWDALARSTFASTYLEDFQALLLPLLDEEPPGMALQQGLSLISQLRHEWPGDAGTVVLAQACIETPESAATQRAICLGAADLLWRSPSSGVFEHKFALGMAALTGATERPPWAERLAFVKSLSPADGQRLMDLEYPANRDGQDCESQPQQRQQLKEQARKGLWAAALESVGGRRTP